MTPVQLFELVIGMFGVVLLLHYLALQLRLLPAERLLRSCARSGPGVTARKLTFGSRCNLDACSRVAGSRKRTQQL